jgi:hypothetical protein
MLVEAHGDAELEVWAGRRQLAMLEQALGKPIVLARVAAEASPHGARSGPRRPARRTLSA